MADDDETESTPGNDVIGVGEGYTVTTYDGDEIEVFVHDFCSCDQACKYGQSLSQPEKSDDTRIVQLTIDVANHGADSYYMDDLETLTAEGYSQPVESAYLWCDYSDDGANRWGGGFRIENGDKKLFYGAFEVQPDATQLVLSSASNGKMVMDIPARGEGSDRSVRFTGSDSGCVGRVVPTRSRRRSRRRGCRRRGSTSARGCSAGPRSPRWRYHRAS